jgi:hypothetical protein
MVHLTSVFIRFHPMFAEQYKNRNVNRDVSVDRGASVCAVHLLASMGA